MAQGDVADMAQLVLLVDDLPSLPLVLAELARLLGSAEYTEQQCVTLIERDQALAVRLLRLANSAFYGVQGRICSIEGAMRVLGSRTVFRALTAAALHGHIDSLACPGFRHDTYWRHTMGTALAACALADMLGSDPDEAFLSGLLHDVGQLVMASFFPEATERAIARADVQQLNLPDAELAEVGFTHAQIGAVVARRWHFPESICRAIEYHHQPEPPGPGERISISGLVQVADELVHALNLGHDTLASVQGLASWPTLDIHPAALEELLASTAQGVKDMTEAFERRA